MGEVRKAWVREVLNEYKQLLIGIIIGRIANSDRYSDDEKKIVITAIKENQKDI